MAQNSAKRKCTSYGPESVSSLGRTNVCSTTLHNDNHQVEVDPFSFLWTVTNYSVASLLMKVKSPVFYGVLSNHAWQVKIHPRKIVDGVEYLSLYLKLKEYGDCVDLKCDEVKANYVFSILNSDGQPTATSPIPNLQIAEFVKGSSLGYRAFIRTEDLFDPARKMVVDDTLKIQCDIKVITCLQQELSNGGKAKCSPSTEERNKRFKDELANDFGKIFKEEIGTDVTISVGKSVLKAHKAVLAVRSSVFAAMFNSNMIEKESSTVEITDFDEAVVKGMLEHLYTGQTECMSQRAPELLEIAEKYNLTGLKMNCEYELGDNLTNENVAVVFVLAHTHNALRLKEKTADFIKRNKSVLWVTPAFLDVVRAQPDQAIFTHLLL